MSQEQAPYITIRKKRWISVKCGLSRDPKHRQAMGESIWLYLHILDIASWDDGIAHDWKDEAAAEDMGMPLRTLRDYRRRLAELGYITCNQKQYTQDIVIHNWTNPREYGGQVYNQGGNKASPQGYTQGGPQGSTQDVTPTSDSKNQPSTVATNVFKTYQDNIGMLTPIVSDKLKDAENTYPDGWIEEAIRLAVTNNKRNWAYCEAILKRWEIEGKTDKKKEKQEEAYHPEWQPFPADDPNKKYIPAPPRIRKPA